MAGGFAAASLSWWCCAGLSGRPASEVLACNEFRLGGHLPGVKMSVEPGSAVEYPWGMALWKLRSAVGVAVLLVSVSMMTAACTSADPGSSQGLHAVDPASAEGNAMLQTATNAAAKELGKPVKLAPTKFNAEQGWTYLSATIQEPDGTKIDWSGTPLAEAAANGGASNRFDGLFQSGGSAPALIESSVGATNPVWEFWRQTHPSVPDGIFH